MACNFPSLTRPDGFAPAALASLSGATTYWKNIVSRLFYLFGHLDLLSTDSFSSPTALTIVAASVHKSKVWFLNFFRLFPYYVAIISPFLPYYSLIFPMSLLFPYYFPIISLLLPYYFPITSLLYYMFIPVFHVRLIFHMSFWFRRYFVTNSLCFAPRMIQVPSEVLQIQSLPQLLWPLGDGMKANANNRYDFDPCFQNFLGWETIPENWTQICTMDIYGSSHL